ncbi:MULTISPECIES: SDR family NAD(P)-dependent oxidoreductase [unclassified Rhizobium]|uniref:SDR family oxidoreductase n=1 Tax=unclassified Rhizobium TaxID=2613769 RepID=UPI001C83F44E|nr:MULTISPECIES: SDR family NAD(P)-dependent oxidoreductase [unclassified Rhizobium]MBX5215310.1 SDR family oxidoreductase [Rhizobium sp. NLR9a]MBX5245108.1 SDR family oxidoreductase [Rhizobium sp. NLR3b]MBX5250111.1 SDR family oxidoreductase [Rhizobium sp. NLR4b]MBX5268822.1 SDR family oxidoreductase [Rhizobium sp. NLR17b]MBX5275829.1 SDR family oxidoreductase [Rhizobium sp. NLR13a]
MELKDKVALVTGAGSGIGKAAALKLAAEGAKVAVLSRTADEVEKTCAEIKAAGGQSISLTADTSDEGQMRAAVQKLTETFNGLDIVVANAGINGVWAPIDDLSPDEWDKTIAVNLRGTYLTLHLTVPHLKRRGGSIVVVASINGTRTFTTPGATAYTATKAGQVAMVQQLALELGRHGIRVNAVCPGEIETNINANTDSRHREETEVPVIWPQGDIPIAGGKAGKSEDVAETILFLASDRARHITGTPIWIDGGQGLLR